MKFEETPLKGAYIIHPQPIKDNRGFFARTWCEKEFEKYGLSTDLKQCNISFNKRKNTLRGMHYQQEPYEEIKLVRCTRGSIYDVIIDLRPNSKTFKKWFAINLTSENRLMLYVPKGFAHGFQTLKDNTEVFYQMTEFYHPEFSIGVRWNDPAFQVKWILKDPIISEKDRNFKLWSDK